MVDWESKLQGFCDKIGASHAGVTGLAQPATWDHYEKWLSMGFSADMQYLKTHADFKKNPQKWKPTFCSAIVVAFPYVDHPAPHSVLTSTRTALYAKGFDYHLWIKERLQIIIDDLQIQFPEEKFECHTDSSPILERDLAQKAGLGWFGKNTCLIHPKKGSLFLIGEILTTLQFVNQPEPVPDFCGTCKRCMEICPTGALISPKVLDANRCISYLTIESKEIPPENLRKSMGDWFFGCDLCQTICPWNQKVFKNRLQVSAQLLPNQSDDQSQNYNISQADDQNQNKNQDQNLNQDLNQDQNLEAELRWILSSSHNQILKKVKGTPYHRAGAKGLKRNALIVVGNRKITSLREEVMKLIENPDLAALAQWTLKEIS